jgi:hypothetical protein
MKNGKVSWQDPKRGLWAMRWVVEGGRCTVIKQLSADSGPWQNRVYTSAEAAITCYASPPSHPPCLVINPTPEIHPKTNLPDGIPIVNSSVDESTLHHMLRVAETILFSFYFLVSIYNFEFSIW